MKTVQIKEDDLLELKLLKQHPTRPEHQVSGKSVRFLHMIPLS